VLVFAALASALGGCPAHFERGRVAVRELTLRGVRQVDEDELRQRLATRDTPHWPSSRTRLLRWWRWWWTPWQYVDAPSLARDRLRIERFYQARGFFDAVARGPLRTTLSEREVRLGFEITEGAPTLVADLCLRDCDGPDPQSLPEATCRHLEQGLRLVPGARFDVALLERDRLAILDAARDAGHPTPRLAVSTSVDPGLHRAWVEYLLRAGPVGRFGRLRFHVLPDEREVQGDLPGGIAPTLLRSLLRIEPGDEFNGRAVLYARQALLDLGVFGIARLDERPRPDGTVDLDVRVSPTRPWRFKLGLGVEADTSRLNLHAGVALDHRNFLGGLRHLHLELRPQVFLPPLTTPLDAFTDNLQPGVAASAEFRQPEIGWHLGAAVAASLDVGPDPVNPRIAFRRALRGSLALDRRFGLHTTASVAMRYTFAQYLPFSDEVAAQFHQDPLYRQQYPARLSYLFWEQNIVWDRRDSPTQPRRGYFLQATLAESIAGPLSDATFLRVLGDARVFVPLSPSTTLAVRGRLGWVLAPAERTAWPVPQELRFYSGGANSNRGYPFNRVGVLNTIPAAAGSASPDEQQRYAALGGVALWEGSVELRWQPGALGAVLFFDASNVSGIDPAPWTEPTGPLNLQCSGSVTNQVIPARACVGQEPPASPAPRASLDALATLFTQAHPTVGLGLRYVTPIGPVRADFGVRLADLACRVATDQLARQQGAAGGAPVTFVVNSPRCDSYPVLGTLPVVLHLTLGEAW
jgi:outer membrane protein assembly factor BamA